MDTSHLSNTLTRTTNWPRSSTQRSQLEAKQREALSAYRLTVSATPYKCEACRDTELVNDPDNDNAAMPCPACASRRKAERMQAICGLTDRERQYNLSQIVITNPTGGTARMVKAAQAFIDAPYGLLTIYGTCGNAKTVALQSIVNASLAKGITAIYTTFYDVVAWVKESFNSKDEDSVSVKVNRLRDVPVLCIDELDKVKQTEWVLELQTQLIDLRYRRGVARQCGTVFAMNGNVDALPDWLSSRMRDGRNVLVENNDKDMRPLVKR